MEDKNKISVVLSAEEFVRFDAYCAEKGVPESTPFGVRLQFRMA